MVLLQLEGMIFKTVNITSEKNAVFVILDKVMLFYCHSLKLRRILELHNFIKYVYMIATHFF
jgi:hypothetical protein